MGGGHFPITRPSLIGGLIDSDARTRARSSEALAAAYWRPVYQYTRLRWGKARPEAEDITQAFFARAFEREALAAYQPGRSRFRAFLRACVDRFVIDEHRHATALRRGGGAANVSDFDAAEDEIAGKLGRESDPAAVFDAAWLRNLVSTAVTRLRATLVARGKPMQADLFERFHVRDDPPSYADAAAELGIKVTDVTNWLHQARREFRRIALDLLREITMSESEFAEEARAVFGIEVDAPPDRT